MVTHALILLQELHALILLQELPPEQSAVFVGCYVAAWRVVLLYQD